MPTVLVTGSSRGIGAATALELAARGHTVYASMRDTAMAAPLLSRAETEGWAIRPIQLDISDPSSIDAALQVVEDDAEELAAVVNNAAQAYIGPVETISADDMHDLFEVNVFGPIRLMQAVLPRFRAQGRGCIVNVSSITARIPGVPFDGLYSATKRALMAITESLSIEVAPFGVRLALIEPGFVATDIYATARRRASDDGAYTSQRDAVERFLSNIVRTAATPDAVARVIGDVLEHSDDDLLHHVVGADAEGLLAVAGSLTDAQWSSFARSTLLGG